MNRLTPKQRDTIVEVFKSFKNNDIKFVILRRHEDLPNSIAGDNSQVPDIDIYVPKSDFNKAVEKCKKLGFETRSGVSKRPAWLLNEIISDPIGIIQKSISYPQDAVRTVYDAFFPHIGKNKNNSYDIAYENKYAYQMCNNNLMLDIKNHLSHKSPMDGSRIRVDKQIEEHIISNRKLKDNLYYIPSPPDELAHIVAHGLFEYDGKFPQYYKNRCQHLLDIVLDRQQYEEQLLELFELLFFDAGDFVFDLVKNKEFDNIKPKLIRYSDY